MKARSTVTLAILLAGSALGSACADESPWPWGDSEGTEGTGAGTDSGAATDSASGTAATSPADGSSDGSPSSTMDDTKWDLGAAPDASSREPEPCENVDVIFVVDNSGSMSGEQENLVESFPGFVDEMLASLDTVESLRVGVTSTDENVDNTPPCDLMGAFIVETPYATCGPYVEGSYMTPDDPLEQTFSCAATLGTGGSGNERPMDALELALEDHQEPGGCNAGFLRDEALLVVVVISDEEDDHESATANSQGDPPDWVQTVVNAKNGIESNAAVLTIVGQDPLGDCETTPFDPHSETSEPGIRLMEFASSFTYSFIGDVCAEDYAPIFHEAISVIDEACTNFTPPAG